MKKLYFLLIFLVLAFLPEIKAQNVSTQNKFDAGKIKNQAGFQSLNNSHYNKTGKSADATTFLQDSSYYMLWQASAWKDYWKFVYTYTPNGNIAVENDFSWDGNLLIYRNYEKFTYTYNAQNQQILHTFLNFEESSNTWEDRSRMYSFYSNNLKVTDSSVFKNPGTSVWEIQWKSNYTYDINANITSQTNYSWNLTTNMWENSYKIVYTNNSSGKPIELMTYNGGVSSWDTSAKTTIVYNPNGLISDETFYSWDQGSHSWQTSVKLVYSYNANSQLLNITKWQWNYITSSLQEVRRDDYSYDANNNNSSVITKTWAGSSWDNAEKHLNYWSIHQINGLEEYYNQDFKVFPNPATNTVFFNNDKNMPLKIRLFDASGKIIIDKLISGNSIDISDLDAGVYFMSVGKKVSKIVKK